ncbi:S41 family peptidase [Candidatus Sneabacter namystus]|uniref:S41 family peptidase n=1 Tax=Candidatus Sneabacter namystus TaxID=2601646 RepID=A0A5C0UIU9_9RICK|nr:S41 family peptidase [Candidatus Sneabacter namystus]QEK39719.1 S41 family peptidase [Candidatus Sneabacter namystus]
MIKFQNIIKSLAWIVLVALPQSALSSQKQDANANADYMNQIAEVFEQILENYVDPLNPQTLTASAIEGMLSSLDPHSTYLTENALQDCLTQIGEQFCGIGIDCIVEDGQIKVVTPIADLPAEKVGIQAGDTIVAVQGMKTRDMGIEKTLQALRGKCGTIVEVTIQREGHSRLIDYHITRTTMKIAPLKYHTYGDIAYLKISSFTLNVATELKKAMHKILRDKKRLDGIILDLRNNPGGLLDSAIEIGEYFLDSGTIVKIRYKNKESDLRRARQSAVKAPKVPIALLINKGTASAAEILSGALQDHKRAIVIGTRSFGKATLQALIPLNHKNSSIKLTVGKYYTPKGHSIDGKGVKPDLLVESSLIPNNIKDYESKSVKNKMITSLQKHDSNTQAQMLYNTDYQYRRAVDLLTGISIANYKYSKGLSTE